MSGYLTKVVIKRLVNCTAVSNHVTQRRLGSLAFLFLFFFFFGGAFGSPRQPRCCFNP